MVAVAAVTAWWAAAGAGDAPTARYLVAARMIGPGDRIGPADVRTTTIDLPQDLRARAFSRPADVVGSISLAPLEPGELLEAGAVTDGTGADPAAELSFSVPTDRAVAGSLRPGDHIDVFATYGDGPSSQTIRVLADATVRRLGSTGGDGLGEDRGQTITVALGDGDRVGAVVNATRAATITVLRVTGHDDGQNRQDRPDPSGSRVSDGDPYQAAEALADPSPTADSGHPTEAGAPPVPTTGSGG